jgi:hypothetical protein
MPPKFQITFLTGQSIKTFAGATPRPLIQFDSMPSSLEDTNRERDQAGTAQLADDVPPHVPSAVLLEPPIPAVLKGDGPSLQIRQLWEGTVTELRDEGFVATLSDKTKPSNPDEQALFEFEYVEISKDDHILVKPGSGFYWMIGTERSPAGQVKNVSSVEFRRSPVWTRSALASADSRASRVKEWFQSEL